MAAALPVSAPVATFGEVGRGAPCRWQLCDLELLIWLLGTYPTRRRVDALSRGPPGCGSETQGPDCRLGLDYLL